MLSLFFILESILDDLEQFNVSKQSQTCQQTYQKQSKIVDKNQKVSKKQ